jgi:hypothetical protein
MIVRNDDGTWKVLSDTEHDILANPEWTVGQWYHSSYGEQYEVTGMFHRDGNLRATVRKVLVAG